jgi:anti-sigma factor RsiW
MIDFDRQLKLQAFLDGELPEAEGREIAAWIAQDREAAALHAELKNTRRALSAAEQGIVLLPETREFYWSKIRRDIERGGSAPRPQATVSGWALLLRWLKPMTVVTAVLLLGVLVWGRLEPHRLALVTAQVDENAITFQDDNSGTTFVWFNFPPENDVANAVAPTTLE